MAMINENKKLIKKKNLLYNKINLFMYQKKAKTIK